ncbi:MAG: TonB-dependent receptor [Acidobacteria bacterium]|nr:TonB-dependent receptor [Acidobacteriota bacterium]
MKRHSFSVMATGLLVWLLAVPAAAQNITGALTGVVIDPAGAAVPSAQVSLTNQQTKSRQTTTTNDAGIFLFPSILPGSYSVGVSMAGFRSHEVKDIAITMNERRSLGDIVLQVGQVQEKVEVTAEATPIQTASSERAGLVTQTQLLNTAIRGRDFVALLATLPGIYDENMQSRDVSKGPGAGGLHINGGRSTSINFALDGIQNTDTGSNGGSHVQPNMDAVAEVVVLTSNYQAEHGRNSGGTINVTTKSGTQEFHGSSYWFYRHESLYANSFFRNRTSTVRPIERIQNFGYTIGGPVYMKDFNKSKDKLFFFWSQEFVRRQNFAATTFVTTPTAIQRQGDFSDTRDVNGALIAIKDPTTGLSFPGNVIPQSRINKAGLAIINYFPLPNYTEADPALRYSRNYRSSGSGAFPRRQDLFRIDYNFSQSMRVYFRGTRDNDDENWLYSNWTAGSHNFDMFNTYRPQRGRSGLIHVSNSFGPTLVNQFTMGASNRAQKFNPSDPSLVARSKMGNIGQWYPAGNESGAIPDVSFGGVQNGINGGIGNIPYTNRNPVLSWVDNVSWMKGNHALKFGIYLERMRKDEVGSGNTRGSFTFDRNTNNPFDSNYAFSNALLGNFNSYSEANRRTYSHYRYLQTEFYAQDSWRVSRKLTLEMGIRFYSSPATHDDRQFLTTFIPSTYSASTAAIMYRPIIDPVTKKRVAVDPRNGAIAPVTYIGLFVPGSGNYAPGMAIGGKGAPEGLYTTPFSIAPRFGFAYDPQGNGRTAIRGGFGMFYDRPQGNVYSGTVGQPPVSYNPTVSFGNLDTFLQATGVVGPPGVTVVESAKQSLPQTMNFSLGVQRELGFRSVIDVSYIGSLARHLIIQRNINSIPMYAQFNPANVDSTTGSPLPDNYLRPYLGMGSINMRTFDGTSNYHGMQVSANRRMTNGLQYGVSYTYAKSLGTANADFGGVSLYFPMRQRNYGPLGYDIRHMAVFNYNYEVPNLGKKYNKWVLGLVTDNWQISGITTFMTGTPFTPGWSTSDGQNITGSQEGATITVVGDPFLPASERTFFRNFKTEAFARTPQRSFGNAGVGIMRNPSWSNWDMSFSKRIPLKSEQRYFQLRGELYNIWNHTQFISYDTSARFNPAGQQINANFGAFSGTRDPRKAQLSLRFMF